MRKYIQILIGSVLGDGHLYRLAIRNQTSQLYLSQHSSKLPYLEWLRDMLNEGISVRSIKPKTGYSQYYIFTKPSLELGELKKKFYPTGTKKIIPADIENLLVHPLSLAVWYMDDGTLDNRERYHRNAMIATYCFSFEDCERLVKAIKINFGFEANVTKCRMRGKIYPRLYIPSKSMPRFISLIKPHIHSCFRYKIGE